MTASDLAEAERLGRRRARALPAFALLFVIQQAAFYTANEPARLVRPVDFIRTGGWLALTLVLLAGLWTGGFWFRRREVRALMDDEVTRAHRADALSLGFLATILAAVVYYLVGVFEPTGARDALHGVVTVGIAVALLRFAMLERRALKDG
jgi:hypothetical protein